MSMIGTTRFGSVTGCALVFGLVAGSLCNAAPVRPHGSEYRLNRPMTGDQVCPHLALGPSGGLLVWHDNRTDGDGLGISARWLDANLSGAFDSFRVNQIAAGDQEHPQAALLRNGGAVFVWQGGVVGRQRIYARFMNPEGSFVTGDLQVSSYTANMQQFPVVAGLADGNVVVLWMSFGQDGDKFGVFGQRFSPAGHKLGSEFQVNQTVTNNQRNPAVVPLPEGGFYVVWINERYRSLSQQTPGPGSTMVSGSGAMLFDVQVFGRRFDAAGNPVHNEQALSSRERMAANPALSVLPDGQMLLAYSGMALGVPPNAPNGRDRWDIWALPLDPQGDPAGAEYRINDHLPGDQYQPRLAAMGNRFMAVWTSLGQDGSREGVFGRAASLQGPVGNEKQINSFWPSQQLYPTIASTGDNEALVVWSSFVGGITSFELLGQRLAGVPALAAPAAPFVTPLSPSQLVATWPALEGLDLECYEIYVDGSTSPLEVTNTRYYLTKLQPGTSHSVQLAYRLADGRRSPLSDAVSGTTWGADDNFDGLPDDWQALYWGPNPALWPGPNVDSDGDGATNLQEFLAGTDPTDPASVLKLELQPSTQGVHLVWTTQPGSIYQIQIANVLGQWTPLGGERLAAGSVDSLLVGDSHHLQMYRVVRIR
jgi:hypothetical protein